uniref:Uncharacterized protein n=1 Tax=Romanomermis culicivorax TaxID=13658 RepID=A0A915HPN9_ROMCU
MVLSSNFHKLAVRNKLSESLKPDRQNPIVTQLAKNFKYKIDNVQRFMTINFSGSVRAYLPQLQHKGV